jgi:hypothetical protein
MSTLSLHRSPATSRVPLLRPSAIAYAIAAVALASLVLAIALTGSPPSSAWRAHRLTPNQAAYVRAHSPQPRAAAASSDLTEQPGIVQTGAPAIAVPPAPASAQASSGWFSVPGHHH